jgi:prevent-host-death family protein
MRGPDGGGDLGQARVDPLTHVRQKRTLDVYVVSGGDAMTLTATELRKQLYRVLERVAETGEPVEVVLKGRTFRIVSADYAPVTFSLDRLAPHPEALVGELDDIVHMDWSDQWRPGTGVDG